MQEATKTHSSCSICGTSAAEFVDFNNGEKRQCPTCNSLERQRVFKTLYESHAFGKDCLAGKKILHVAPSSSEDRILSSIPDTKIVTLDIGIRSKVDIKADLACMPEAADDSFDAVYISGVFYMIHPQKLSPAIAEIARVLKPGGILFSWDKVNNNQKSKLDKNINSVIRTYGLENYNKYGVGEHWTFSIYDYEDFFSDFFHTALYCKIDKPTLSCVYYLKAICKKLRVEKTRTVASGRIWVMGRTVLQSLFSGKSEK